MSLYVVLCTKYTNKICLNQTLSGLRLEKKAYIFFYKLFYRGRLLNECQTQNHVMFIPIKIVVAILMA